MTIKEAKAIEMIAYLSYAGIEPAKIKGENYWFYSPFREEKTPSFKVNRKLNNWYNFGIGKGGNLVDLILLLENIPIPDILQKLERLNLSAHELVNLKSHQTGIEIITTKPITSPALIRYYQSRRIVPEIAQQFLCEVDYQNNGKNYYALGFKNDSGGYELRSPYFKGSSHPKGPTIFRNNAASLAVFEGPFDFLSYQTICLHQSVVERVFLILNSTSFFEQQLPFVQSYPAVHLYLDNDATGDKFTGLATALNPSQFIDERALYKGHKDVNDWHQHPGLQQVANRQLR